MKEIWKDVKGYEGIYEVSNLGNVRSLDRYITCKNGAVKFRKGKIINFKTNNRDYVQVRLNKDGKTEHWLLHRLVAVHFIDNPDNLPQVNHKDEDKNNNTVDNLEWCTNIYNRHYGTGIERMAANHNYEKIKKLNSIKVNQYSLDGKFIKTWDCISDANRHLEKKRSSLISKACKNERNIAYGYKWEYAD